MMDHLPITVGTWNKCRESKAVFSNGINRHNPKIIIASFVMITVTTHIVIVNEIMFIITVYIYIIFMCHHHWPIHREKYHDTITIFTADLRFMMIQWLVVLGQTISIDYKHNPPQLEINIKRNKTSTEFIIAFHSSHLPPLPSTIVNHLCFFSIIHFQHYKFTKSWVVALHGLNHPSATPSVWSLSLTTTRWTPWNIQHTFP